MENETNNLKHIAVIIDGNRRYAKSRLLPTYRGHEEGAERVKDFLKWCQDLEIKEITIYALSTENLKREKEELDNLFKLFRKFFKELKESKELKEKSVKIRFIGDLNLIPREIRELALELEKETKDNTNCIVNFCFAYGGRLELTQTINKLLKSGKKQVTEQDITNSLWLSSEPELIIRTGAKSRTSNFLPWQTVYSEWSFLDKMWPEITKEDLIGCIERFKKTKRNFGK
jgi:undecaprenyl diphosphate synthase